jgi:hypothetical protein
MKSTPRVTPYSFSPPLRCFRFRDDVVGTGEDLFLFCGADPDDSAAPRCVDVTTRVSVTQTGG